MDHCTLYISAATNNLLAVSIKRSEFSSGWHWTCSLLSGFPAEASASCRVAFGTDPSFTSLPYSASSTGEAAANGSVTVSITERLNSSTTYYYRVTANEGDNPVVTVLGSFSTGLFSKLHTLLCTFMHAILALLILTIGCDEQDLAPDEHYVINASIECASEQLGFAGEDSMSLRGVVCYSGTVPGSLAVYRCITDFQFSGNSSVHYRVCQSNGLWSNGVSICTPVFNSSKYNNLTA